jgi:FkbM family methyltransferase
MDVGAGSGILALFAARAGAKKVIAVEASNVAQSAKKLAEKNGLGHIVKIGYERIDRGGKCMCRGY